MKVKDKHKELNKKMLALLTEYFGHEEYGYALSSVNLSDSKKDKDIVVSNMPEEYLFKHLMNVTKQLARKRGII